MATIQINNLDLIGSDLFVDTESYLQDLSDSEVSVQGGVCISRTSWIETIITISLQTF